MATQHFSSTAVTYARSLFELAQERKSMEAIGGELSELQAIVAADPGFGAFLSDPSISRDERAGVIERSLKPQVSPLLGNFLSVLNLHGRTGLLAEIAAAFKSLLDIEMGNIEVDVTVARELDADQLDNVRQKVSLALHKNAVVKQHVDPAIIGGMILKIEDKLIDASVVTQLKTIKSQLLAAKPN